MLFVSFRAFLITLESIIFYILRVSITQKIIPFENSGIRAGDPATVIAASKKAQEVLDWSPEHSDLDSLIRSTWEVYK